MCILIAGHLRFQQLTQILNMKTLSKISIPYIGKFSLGSYFRDFADCIRSRENKNRNNLFQQKFQGLFIWNRENKNRKNYFPHFYLYIANIFVGKNFPLYGTFFYSLRFSHADCWSAVKTYANKKTLIEEKYWRTVGSNQLSFPSALPTELLRMIWRADFNFYINCTARYLLIIEYPLVLSRFCSYNSLNLTNPDVFNFRRNNIIH